MTLKPQPAHRKRYEIVAGGMLGFRVQDFSSFVVHLRDGHPQIFHLLADAMLKGVQPQPYPRDPSRLPPIAPHPSQEGLSYH